MSDFARLVEKVTVDGSSTVFDVVWAYCGYGTTPSSLGASHAVSSKTAMETSVRVFFIRFIRGSC